MRPIELVRARLESCGCNPRGPERKFEARCPVHDDHRASLSVTEGDDGRVLLHCHAGCDPQEIPPRLGLSWGELFPEARPKGHKSEAVAEYLYENEGGEPLFKVVRKADKQFPQARPDGSGGWAWGIKGVRRVPYRLPRVVAAVAAGQTIYVVEGEKDVHALERAGVVATTNPGGVGRWRPEFSKVLASANVIIIADRDEPGLAHARAVVQSLRAEDCTVRVVQAAEGKDAHDHLAAGKGLDDFTEIPEGPTRDPSKLTDLLVSEILKANPEMSEEDLEDVDSLPGLMKLLGNKKSVTSEVVKLVEEAEVQLFHDAEDTPYATFDVDGHSETWKVRSQGFKGWVRRLYFTRKEGDALNGQAVADALALLEAKAMFDGPELDVHLRVAEADGAIYVDLGDELWRVIAIARDGWHITDTAPIRFRRTRGMLALPEPERNGDLNLLRPFVNVNDDDSWRLLVSWVLAALRPGVPCPVLSIGGEQGSAKSTLERVARACIDPNTVPLRSPPTKQDDLMVSANSSWIVAYDNLSGLQDWLSDALARLCTGGGISKRELYTDSDEVLLNAQRPVMVNGIGELVERSDLLDRAIMLELPVIAEEDYEGEEEFWSSFSEVHGRILGGLCDAVSSALARVDQTRLSSPTRMADFAKWVSAAEESLGWEPGSFIKSFAANRGKSHELAIEASLIGPHLRAIAGESFDGTVAALLEKLNGIVGEKVSRQKEWPKSAKGLKSQITRLAPNLRKLGYIVA